MTERLPPTLRENGPPPYADLFKYELALSHEHDWNRLPELRWAHGDGLDPVRAREHGHGQAQRLRCLPRHLLCALSATPGVDFRDDVPSLDVPVYMVIGRHEARGRAVLADEWFAMLKAPAKERIVFENSGHRPSFEEPAAFAAPDGAGARRDLLGSLAPELRRDAGRPGPSGPRGPGPVGPRKGPRVFYRRSLDCPTVMTSTVGQQKQRVGS